MTVSLRCPSCQYRFRIRSRADDCVIRCPNPDCEKRIRVRGERRSDVLPPQQARSDDSISFTAAQPQQTAVPARRATRRRRTSGRPVTDHSRWRPALFGFGGTVFAGCVLFLFISMLPDGEARLPFGRAATSRSPAAAGDSHGVMGAVSARTAASDSSLPTEIVRKPAISGDDVTAAAAATTMQLTAAPSPAEQKQQAEDQRFLEDQLTPYLQTYCIDCHGPDEQMAGIAVHKLAGTGEFMRDRKTWERVYRMINAGAMPPSDYDPLPDDAERERVSEYLYDQLYNFDCDLVHHPGRPTIQRLNRAEYNNTVRDLFGVKLRPADEFPADDVGEGFDNIGDVLSLPPLLMEKYLDAAEEVAEAVIDTHDYSKPLAMRFTDDQLVSSLDRDSAQGGFKVLYTNGSISARVDVPTDGTYTIRVEANADQAGKDKAKVAVEADGNRVRTFEITGHRKPEWLECDVQLRKGRRTVAAVFLNDFYDKNASGRKDRNVGVRVIEVVGPDGGIRQPQRHEIHERLVTVYPGGDTTVREAAAQVLQPILYRAFRRPVSEDEVNRYAGLVSKSVNEFGETYEQGLSMALQAMLVAPDFLFRLEPAPQGDQTTRRLNDFEIASRLSYFLWSSMPDDDLLAAATHGRLQDESVVRAQIARMLRDDKAEALASNFAAQWLNLRNLAEVTPNPDVFPNFDQQLKDAMAQETELLFKTIVREDRSIDEFLTADYTFVNERLAEHYGLKGVTGDEFTRVALSGTNRSGVLTHASILTLTSNPGRTSPVKRGKWILENILNDAPPPAPPSVPPLEDTAEAQPGLSLREQLAIHREDPGCASCHKTMDPLGLGLENFDAVGRWRDRDGDHAIDATGELPDGDRFQGPMELLDVIKRRKSQFHRALAERMLTYALGRGLEYYDKCAIDDTLKRMEQHGNRFSALVEGIVLSDCFQMRSRDRDPKELAASN